ncbi:MAG: TPM domain-containing protein [Synechococcales cyanobacterium K44_A2020_017]|nr:TPM domain-containing protein [Synechococcales cyanobacterium K32_A2020_035]MBF2094392.1 TPM domain-containing protein [Synechococcales cyanobacterium K44_A2020_017]
MVKSANTASVWTALCKSVLIALVSVFFMLQVGALPAHATGVYSMPSVAAGDPTWVIDEADIISRLNQGKLDRQLAAIAEETGVEVRFVTFHRLDYGETAQSFADQLFETWFPTPESQANQVVLVLDNVTNTTAIHADASVSDRLTAEIAESVAQETLQVPIRDGNKYNQAFLDAGDRLLAVLTGQPDPGPPVVEVTIQTEGTYAKAEETDQNSSTVLIVGFLIAATVIPMVTYYIYVR